MVHDWFSFSNSTIHSMFVKDVFSVCSKVTTVPRIIQTEKKIHTEWINVKSVIGSVTFVKVDVNGEKSWSLNKRYQKKIRAEVLNVQYN